MALDAAEQMEHQGATVGRQRRVSAVKQRVGQVGGEGHKRVEGFWCQREEEGRILIRSN